MPLLDLLSEEKAYFIIAVIVIGAYMTTFAIAMAIASTRKGK